MSEGGKFSRAETAAILMGQVAGAINDKPPAKDIVEGMVHEAIAMLRKNTVLRSMKLGRNELGSEGAAVLADALTKNTTLTVLTLGGNEIGSEGAASLAEGLKLMWG